MAAGDRAKLAMLRCATAGSPPSACPYQTAQPGDRCRRPGGDARLYRHQDPFGFHAADQPKGREQGAPGRDHGDRRPLWVFGRAHIARQAAADPGLLERERAVAAIPRDAVSRISRYLSGSRGQCRDAGRAPHPAAQRDGHGSPAAKRLPNSNGWRRCSKKASRPGRWVSPAGCSRRPAAMPTGPKSSRYAMC